MGDMSKSEGRTVLFVSHNMSSIRNLCNSGLFLDNGMIKCFDQIDKIIPLYNDRQLLKNKQNIKFELAFDNSNSL
jgi:lipopolysaccharide transport system ATP-binding protein